ncbi:hypothetical protein LSH36_4g21017 [Paralvinella palmiformis]|uniref:Uncharacterized protein n=1 Tax=Paralvinella palmiformis TaxID=53620 RepID=A0AAD9KFE6_9ANNE|nr:hypothetical protein LSH36_4g21017 [Paralvinella palmiformis]
MCFCLCSESGGEEETQTDLIIFVYFSILFVKMQHVFCINHLRTQNLMIQLF